MIPTLTSIDQREFQLARDEPSRSPSRRSHSHARTFPLPLLSLYSAQTGMRVCVCVGPRWGCVSGRLVKLYLIRNQGPGSIKKHQTCAQICHSGRADRAVPRNWMEGWREVGRTERREEGRSRASEVRRGRLGLPEHLLCSAHAYT